MAANPKMITLRSSDNENFDVEEAVVLEFGTFKLLLEDGCVDNTVPVPNVTGTVLAKVIEYCKRHVEAAAAASDVDELKKWDAEFVKMDQNTLFELISAANYLNVKSLLDLTCQTVADMITGKTPEDMRKFFNIENDYSPEEEEKVRKENLWAFQ